MKRVMEKVDELVREIKQGDIYQEYLKVRDELEQNAELNEQVALLRSRNFQIQKESTAESIFEETSIMEKEFCELRKNPLVNEYLDAELALCKMLKAINVNINEEMEISIPSGCF